MNPLGAMSMTSKLPPSHLPRYNITRQTCSKRSPASRVPYNTHTLIYISTFLIQSSPTLHPSLSTTLSENALHPIIIPSPRAVSTRQVRFACYPGIRMRIPSHHTDCPRATAHAAPKPMHAFPPPHTESLSPIPLPIHFRVSTTSQRRSHIPKPFHTNPHFKSRLPNPYTKYMHMIPFCILPRYQARLGFRACIKQKNAYQSAKRTGQCGNLPSSCYSADA